MLARIFIAVLLILTMVTTYTQTHKLIKDQTYAVFIKNTSENAI
jgi:hypothetical protein